MVLHFSEKIGTTLTFLRFLLRDDPNNGCEGDYALLYRRLHQRRIVVVSSHNIY